MYRVLFSILGIIAIQQPVEVVANEQDVQESTTEPAAAIKAQSLFVKGMTAAYIDKHDRAVGYFQASLKLRPGSADVLVQLARSHEQLDDIDAALFYARQAVDIAPTEHNLLFLSHILDKNGQLEESLIYLDHLLSLAPNIISYQLNYVDALIRSGRYDDAAESLVTFLLANSGSTGQDELLSLVSHATENADDLLDALSAMTEAQPDNVDLLVAAGIVHIQRGNFSEAIRNFEVVEALAPGHPESARRLTALRRLSSQRGELAAGQNRSADPGPGGDQFSRAQSLFEHGGRAELLEADSILTQLNAKDVTRLSRMLHGEVLISLERYAEASIIFDEVLETDVRNLETWQKAAAASLYAGRIDHTFEVTRDGLLFFSDDPTLVEILAVATLATERQIESEDIFLRTLDRTENKRSARAALYLLAVAHLHQISGQLSEAREYLDQAVMAQPSNPFVLAVGAAFRSKFGNGEGAIEDVEVALAGTARHPVLDLYAARVFHLDGQNDHALALTETLLSQHRTSEALELKGDILYGLNRVEEARASWNEALDLDPGRKSILEKLDQRAQ